MDDSTYQKKNLEAIYNAGSLAPVFKRPPKYNVGKFAGLVPYIAYGDIIEWRYIIRARPVGVHDHFDGEEREVIAEYDSIEGIVKDGWRLD